MFCKSFCILLPLFAVLLCSCSGSSENKESVHDSQGTTKISEVDLGHGKLVYEKNCKVCHQDKGQGISGYYPPVVNTKTTKGDKGYLIKVLLNGLSGPIKVEGEDYNGVMASYKNLSNGDIASVLNYIRSMSGGEFEPVAPGDVEVLR